MARAEPGATIGVQVAYAEAPHRIDLTCLRLPLGASVLDALKASGLAARHGHEAIDALVVAVWGKARPLDTALREGDRVELLRALTVDPKEARRQRYRRDGVRRAPR
jgi:putative ubiquitin-RnfH superfamily antitoxin RatB of RatAB toxin-antitoxin module